MSKNQEKTRRNAPQGAKTCLKTHAKKRHEKRCRTGAHLSAPQIPRLSLPRLGKGGPARMTPPTHTGQILSFFEIFTFGTLLAIAQNHEKSPFRNVVKHEANQRLASVRRKTAES